jgi:hypothetical protein
MTKGVTPISDNIYMKEIKKTCPICKKEISCSASHANATVSHMACAMKATEHLRKKSKKS